MTNAADVDTLLDQAIRSQTDGSLAEAEALYRQVIDADPDNADALNLLGLLLQSQDQLPEALALIERALAIDPEFPEALANKARGLNLLQQWDDAIAAAEAATRLDPELAEAWQQLGLARLRAKQPEAARDAFQTADRLSPDDLSIQTGLAEAAMQALDHATVAAVLPNLLVEDPDNVQWLKSLGIALTALDRFDEAVALERHALELAPEDDSTRLALAVTLHKQSSDHKSLEELCRDLLTRHPESMDCRIMLAAVLTWTGRFEEAKATYREALTIDPSNEDSRSMLSGLETVTGGDQEEDLDTLRARLANPSLSILQRASAGHTIGRALERTGDYDGGANLLVKEDLAKRGKGFNRREFQRYVNWASGAFTDTVFKQFQPHGDHSDLPVFIVGMPRSGTTLVEQILSSHPAVFGGGERFDIDNIMQRITRGPSPVVPAQWDVGRMRFEATQHVRMLRELGGGASRVIDKMPDNLLNLGQIALMFPNARIILCQRDPRDVGLSCFVSHFTDSLPWTNDLDDIGFRAKGAEYLTKAWRHTVPLKILELSYETLVANLEAESRRMIDFLGLEWDPRCLDFHENKRGVSTASYWQVRQPLYDTSVGRWRKYESQLRPLLNILASSDWEKLVA